MPALPALKPAQKYVTGRLHEAMTSDHTLTMVRIIALTGVSFQH